jgi:hypothetical protein
MYHKEYFWGKGVWIDRVAQCLGGDIDALIAHCKTYDISHVFIKNGDGTNVWTQLTKDIVRRFQDDGIKVYAWSYNYGRDAVGEANVAIHNLDLGVNGFVFYAKEEYRDAPNNTDVAEMMLQTVRAKYPDAFLAYAPLAIIDFHTGFPYITFGKHCDAAMPQVYYGLMKKTPQQAILWMYDNWSRWMQNWIENGHEDSVKPIAPIAQAFDEYQKVAPPYVLNPADIQSFVSVVKNYKTVSFYVFHEILRPDCWEAIRTAQLEMPTEDDLRTVVETVETQEEVVTTDIPIETVEELVVETQEAVEVVQEEAVSDVPAETTPAIEPTGKPKSVELTTDSPANIAIPNEKTTVTFSPRSDGTVKMTLHPKKIHQEYVIEFYRWLVGLFRKKR